MANIQKRVSKSGEITYRIRISDGYDTNGKQIIKSFTFKPEAGLTERQGFKQAQLYALQYEERFHNGDRTVQRTKFKDLAETWFAEVERDGIYKLATLDRLRDCKARTYDAIGNVFIDSLTRQQVKSFIQGLTNEGVNKTTGGGLSSKTQKHYLTFISDVCNYAIDIGILNNNPCTSIRIKKTTDNDHEVYSLEEAAQVLVLIDTYAELKYRLFFHLLATYGMRRAEALGLEFSDFTPEKFTIKRTSNYRKGVGIYTDSPKTRKSRRTLETLPEIWEMVQQLKEIHDRDSANCGDQWTENDRLFIQWDGKPIHPNTPYTWLERFCKRYNVPFKALHSFRHFVATTAIANGADIVSVSAILGHNQTSTTTDIYAHDIEACKVKSVRSVNDTLKEAMQKIADKDHE